MPAFLRGAGRGFVSGVSRLKQPTAFKSGVRDTDYFTSIPRQQEMGIISNVFGKSRATSAAIPLAVGGTAALASGGAMASNNENPVLNYAKSPQFVNAFGKRKQIRNAMKSRIDKFFEFTQTNPAARKVGLGVQGVAESFRWVPGVKNIPGMTEETQPFNPQTAGERAVETGAKFGGEAVQLVGGAGPVLSKAGMLGAGKSLTSRMAQHLLTKGRPAHVFGETGIGAVVGAAKM